MASTRARLTAASESLAEPERKNPRRVNEKPLAVLSWCSCIVEPTQWIHRFPFRAPLKLILLQVRKGRRTNMEGDAAHRFTAHGLTFL